MRKALIALALTLAATAFVPAHADTPSPATQMQYLVGTWDCTTTGSTPLNESMSVEALAGGAWLHGSATAQVNQRTVNEESYLEWDATASHWVLIQIVSTGGYAVSTSSSPMLNGSAWTALGDSSGATATLTENSASQYTLERSGFQGGRKVTIDEVCTRQ